jgi:hypothetical protein
VISSPGSMLRNATMTMPPLRPTGFAFGRQE